MRFVSRNKRIKMSQKLLPCQETVIKKNGKRILTLRLILLSSELHVTANGSPLIPGELVLMDVAASYRGYHADVTRTLAFARASLTPKQNIFFQMAKRVYDFAVQQIRPGRFLYSTKHSLQ